LNVDVIVNCTARRLGDSSLLREVIARAAGRGGARVHATYTLGQLEDVARAIAARKADAVVLAGGDGSYMAGLSALGRALGADVPPVGLAPGGTVCTIARNLGLRGDPCAWAEQVVSAACTGGARLVEHGTLRVTDDAGGDRIGFIFGAGLVARFFDEYYAGGRLGLVPAGALAGRVLAGSLVGTPFARRVLAPVACSVEVDGARHAARRWSLVLASVVRDVGLHVRVAYRAGGQSGRFHVVASGLGPRGLAFEAPRVLAGRAMRGEPRVDALARSLRVAFEARDAYVLDGDVVAAGEVRVAVGPTIRVIVPPDASSTLR
jgi:diacylglycerol kinase family enzyme